MRWWPPPRRPRVLLGNVGHPWLRRPYSLDARQIASHKHVMGLTGQGKSKFLASLFVQLHSQGIACALIDPHADLALDVLGLLHDAGAIRTLEPSERLCYVDFSQQSYYLPFNVLAQPYPPHTIARNIVEVCKRVWPALADGAAPTFENILLHAVVVLVENHLPLTTLPQLLTDQRYRDGLLRQVTDPQVLRFFHDRYDQWGREGPLMRESTLNRVALLTFSPTLRYSLGQLENALDFRQLMDDGVSVIFNLGGLDEETQRFLGCLLTVGFEVAALSRADLPEERRRQYHLILDEFAMFSAPSEEALARVLSLARKYGLYLTLAHQTWSQISQRLQGALQNTVSIAFKLGRSDAEWAAPRFGRFDERAIRHEVADPQAVERTHPVYWGLAETFERWATALEDLKPREAYVKVGQRATKIRTRTVARPRVRREHLQTLIQNSAQRLMRPAAEVMTQVDAFAQAAPRVASVRRMRAI